MTLPRTVAEVLSEHVVFEVECIDRMYLNVYVPQLQHAGGLLGYVQRQLGLSIARAQNVQFWIMLQAWRTSLRLCADVRAAGGVLRPGN